MCWHLYLKQVNYKLINQSTRSSISKIYLFDYLIILCQLSICQIRNDNKWWSDIFNAVSRRNWIKAGKASVSGFICNVRIWTHLVSQPLWRPRRGWRCFGHGHLHQRPYTLSGRASDDPPCWNVDPLLLATATRSQIVNHWHRLRSQWPLFITGFVCIKTTVTWK